MTDLSTRIEQAGEGCRELDQDIFCDLGLAPFVEGAFNAYQAPHYTTSIDAAMTLVPEGAVWLRKTPNTMSVYIPPIDEKVWATHIDAKGATPAMALAAAAIRARGL